MDTFCVQPGLFGDNVERSRLRKHINKVIRRQNGKQQHQYSLKIRGRKTPRLIDFKPRLTGEERSNDFTWEAQSIVRLHMELIREWEERFNTCSEQEKASYWLWMLGDRREDFSFYNCLVLTGFTSPDTIIDTAYERRPQWFREIETMADDDEIAKTLRRHFGN